VRRANEKGVVEGVVKFGRLNFFVPVPQVEDMEELNARLDQQCREDLGRKLRGKTQTKTQLLEGSDFVAPCSHFLRQFYL
jgi:transposase